MRSSAPPVSLARPWLSARSAPRWECVAVGTAAFLALFLAMPRFIGVYDEGIVLSDAMRIASGDVVHRDFYSTYGPVQYYVVAGLLRWFQDGFLAARCYDVVVRAGIVALTFGIVRAQASLTVSLFFAGVCGLLLACIGTYLYPLFPCVPLALIGSWLLARNAVTQTRGTARMAAAGLCTGLAALVRYDIGGFLLVAHAVSIAALAVPTRPRGAGLRRAMIDLFAYGIGVGILFIPAAAAFLLVSPIAPFKADIIEFPSHYYAAMRRLPFPGLPNLISDPTQLSIYVPLLAAASAAIEMVVGRRRRGAGVLGLTLTEACLVVFGLAAVVLFFKGIVRVSPVHMFLGIVPGLIVLALVTARWWPRGGLWVAASVAIAAVPLIPAVASAADFYKAYRIQSDELLGPWLAVKAGLLSPGRASLQCDLRPVSGSALIALEYVRVAHYLAAHTRPDERILAAVDRHDKILINPVVLYYTVGRLPGTHWHHYDPGLQTRADIQQAMIADLQHNHVRWVVRDGSYDEINEPNESAKSSGMTLLDAYLDTHYRRVAGAGKVAIWLEDGQDPGPASADPCEAKP